MSPVAVLKEKFGFSSFRQGQQDVIEQALNGNDTLVLMPTGGGKSLCYQIPALILPGYTLVVSPLIALMKDQVDNLAQNGIKAAFLNANLDMEHKRQIRHDVTEGSTRLLYVSPEWVVRHENLQWLAELPPAMIAIDEAHCVSHWGHDFRKDYTQLWQLKQNLPQVPIMALTATADIATRGDIAHQLQLNDPFVYVGSFDRANIRYSQVEKVDPQRQLVRFLKEQEGSGIVYCSSRRKTEEISALLLSRGLKSAHYHAGLEYQERETIQQDFIRDNIDIMVATVAFGMGIDKSDVRYVVHYEIPKSIEAYYQESGRAGRDGMPAEALLMFDRKDEEKVKRWISQGDSARQAVEEHRFKAMAAFAETESCRRQVVLNYFGESALNACGNCDTCLYPPSTYDGLVDAQKVLSCIYRLNQKVDSQYVALVLTGNRDAKILNQQHDKLPTFGVGKDKPLEYWMSITRQLVHRGYLQEDITNAGRLLLQPSAKSVLKGQCELTLAVPRLKVYRKSRVQHQNYDKPLFSKLKRLRKSLADEHEVPPYVVFSDATLTEMSAVLPTTKDQLLSINGVGMTKLERFGEAFLHVICQHLESH